jgi:hypothetical protein
MVHPPRSSRAGALRKLPQQIVMTYSMRVCKSQALCPTVFEVERPFPIVLFSSRRTLQTESGLEVSSPATQMTDDGSMLTLMHTLSSSDGIVLAPISDEYLSMLATETRICGYTHMERLLDMRRGSLHPPGRAAIYQKNTEMTL